MPRYEPNRNAVPLIKEGQPLKMRRTEDGRWEPAPATPSPSPSAPAASAKEAPDGEPAAAPRDASQE